MHQARKRTRSSASSHIEGSSWKWMSRTADLPSLFRSRAPALGSRMKQLSLQAGAMLLWRRHFWEVDRLVNGHLRLRRLYDRSIWFGPASTLLEDSLTKPLVVNREVPAEIGRLNAGALMRLVGCC